MRSLGAERSYPFTDFIRFVAMTAIIFQHSFIVNKDILATDHQSVLFFFCLKVVAKIGSISFFIVSGFLLSDALGRYSVKEYLNKRLKNIVKPYMLFVALYLLLDSVGAFFGQEKISTISRLPEFLIEKTVGILFFTSYWFIFSYFISLLALLILRKYLYEKWLGIVLLCWTLIFSINVHGEWFPPHHTTAMGGFTFFLWLGANLKKREVKFWNFIDTTPYGVIVALALTTLSVAFYETIDLLNKGAMIADGSLNISTIFYCFSIFLLLAKAGRNVRFSFVNPRVETYPLYLVHPILLKVIIYGLMPILPAVCSFLTIDRPQEVHWLAILLYHVGWFLGIYFLSLVAVKLVLNSPFRWVFGKNGKEMLTPAQSFK